jgi:hypothetical protein
MSLQKTKPVRSKAIRESAQGEMCQVRVPGICTHDPQTVVLAHLGCGGMGTKKSDIHAAYCCHACHQIIDGAARSGYPKNMLELWHRQGVERTQDILIEKGLLVAFP